MSKWPLTVKKFIEQSDRWYGSDALYAQPVSLDSDGEIIIDSRESRPIMRAGRWRGRVSLFYEEKPKFVAILMAHEQLCGTVVCDTLSAAVDAGVKFVKEYSTLVDLRAIAREFLEVQMDYSFSEGGYSYTIHIGEPDQEIP